MNDQTVKTRQEARQWFIDHGLTITEWAMEKGFNRSDVYAVLAGRTIGNSGLSHKIAVALCIKADPQPQRRDRQLDLFKEKPE